MDASVARSGWLRHVAGWAHHRHAAWALGAVAFADSSLLPVPPDLLLVPMALLRPERLKSFLLICLAGSSLGAVLGYVIGYALWNTVGLPLVQFYGYSESFADYQRLVAEWGVCVIVAKAFTPVPFKIAAIAAGIAAMDPLAFLLATVVGRALHFAMVGAVLVFCGPRIMALLARYQRPFMLATILVLIAAVAVFHFR
ncbi:MAG: VTT domain-containing protein [Alphaproteobacteria bacterium]|nr:VTT domain-containing protein [Alphaproteobacteria bacterium]MBV9150186.1 VTT domain-containing protein [Alphaproteobacteria bacterium]